MQVFLKILRDLLTVGALCGKIIKNGGEVMSFEENVEKIEEAIGYRFRDRSLLRQAFTRTSWCNEQNRGRRVKFQSSEVLEFIGDSALSTAIITMLM